MMRQAVKTKGFTKTNSILSGLCFLLVSAAMSSARAEDPPHEHPPGHSEPSIFMVEEDWEMTLNQPDARTNSPQVAFFLHPDALHSDRYFQVQMNYAAEEGYSSGGFRVGAFVDEVPLDEERSKVKGVLSWDNDTVRWTSAMARFNDQLMFALKDGSGYQWGAFGGPEYLVAMPEDDIHDLDHYSPQESVNNVDIGFGRNRIKSLRLKKVRVTYTNNTQKMIEVNLDAL